MKPKVLVIDDSEMVLEATQLALEDGCLEVVTLSSPALFPTTLNRQKPDLVLLDVGMPIMSGDSLVTLTRKNRLHQCPIVLYSDRSEADLQTLATACGANGYVKKTSDPVALVKAVKKFLPAIIEKSRPDQHEVYLVDDQPMIRALLEEHLKRAGCTPVMLDNAEKCVEMAKARPPAMIILDLHMQGMRGDEACKALRRESSLREVPIVMMTSRASPDEVIRWWEYGADDFIFKPVRPDQLESKVRAVIGQKRRQQAAPTNSTRVLLATGDGSPRNRIGLLLEASGYRVRYAANDHEAMLALNDPNEFFDAAICDVALVQAAKGLIDKLRVRARRILWILPPNTPDQLKFELGTGDEIATVEQHHPPELILTRLNGLLRRIANDLRLLERVPFYSAVEFRTGSSVAWACGFSHDLSPAGLFVRTLTPPPKGTEVEFRISDLPDGPAIEGRSLVAWSNEYGPRITYSYPVGMGLQFSSPDAPTQRRLQSLYEASRLRDQAKK